MVDAYKATTGIEPVSTFPRLVSGEYRLGRVRVVITDGPLDTPCHIWQGCVTSKGYPSRTINKQPVLGHRAAYQEAHGEIPEGIQIHHACEQRRCVNPAHLAEITPLDHTRHHVGRAAERAEALLADGRWWKRSQICRALPDASPDAVRQGLYRARLAGDGKGWYRMRGVA